MLSSLSPQISLQETFASFVDLTTSPLVVDYWPVGDAEIDNAEPLRKTPRGKCDEEPTKTLCGIKNYRDLHGKTTGNTL